MAETPLAPYAISMSLKSKLEAIIYAAEEPVTVEQIVNVLKESAPELLAAPNASSSGENKTVVGVSAGEGTDS